MPYGSPDISAIKQRLAAHSQASKLKLHSRFPAVKTKLDNLGLDLKNLRRHSSALASAAVIAAGALTAAPLVQHTIHPHEQRETLNQDQLATILHQEITPLLPAKVTPLSPQTTAEISQIVANTLEIKALATLDHNRLPTNYGFIGQEQHLPRYPGDTIRQHDALQEKGLTQGLGGFGYFSRDRASLTHETIMQEKYYVAVPLMYLPNWKQDTKYLAKWFRFRKVLVINPKNGKAIVAVIGDAGPAAWTGKSFGGSPELMQYLELKDGRQKGAVVMLFVDESSQPIAVGPVGNNGVYIASK